YDWSFGDGAGLTTGSLGKPYPVESDLQHTYEFSSLRHAEGFPIRVTAEYSAAFRVDGGAWQGLRTVRRTYGTGHRVQEIQTVLGGGRGAHEESDKGDGVRPGGAAPRRRYRRGRAHAAAGRRRSLALPPARPAAPPGLAPDLASRARDAARLR